MGARAQVGAVEVGAELGSASANYEITASREDQGTYEVSGPSLTAQVGRVGFDYQTDTITEIFDEDLGTARYWREEISDGEFVYEIRNGEKVPIRADFAGGIRVEIKGGIFHIDVKIDIFRMIFEATQ